LMRTEVIPDFKFERTNTGYIERSISPA